MPLPPLTRRTFLITSTAVLAAAATGAEAAGPVPEARRDPLVPSEAHSQLESIDFTVLARAAQDVTALHYILTNVGTGDETYTVTYIDETNGRRSRTRFAQLAPGETWESDAFGTAGHDFLVEVCQSDGLCLDVGPVASAQQT